MAANSNTLTWADRWGSWKGRLRGLFVGESRRQILVSISSLAGSGLICVGLRFIGSIIQGRFIGPEVLGYYNKFTILPDYLFFLHMGIYTSLARQYPYYLGKGDKGTALTYASNALGWTYLLGAIHAVVFLVPSALAAVRGDWPAALGWGTQSIVSGTTLYMFYLGATYRNSSEFVDWSKASIVSAVVSLASLPLVALYQFFGLCVRYSVPNLLSSFYAHWKRPLKIRAHLDRQILKKMVAYGAPLMIFAYLSTSLWDAVARSYILNVTDEKMLGVFAFSFTLCAALTTVSSSISQVFNPRIAMLYGSSRKSMAVSFKYCWKCSLTGLIAMLPLVILTYWLFDPLVRLLLPKYTDAIPIARCLCWLSLIPVLDLPKQLLMVAKRTRAYGTAVVTSFFMFLAALGTLYFWGENISLKQIVIAYVACKLVTVIISNMFAWYAARLELRIENRQGSTAT
jgi:O-antigen/teichoic acid export membrane protein